jgi:hypothetical protein
MRDIDWQEWFPKLLGGITIVVCLIFWMVTERVEPLFVTTGGGLIALGHLGKARNALRGNGEME